MQDWRQRILQGRRESRLLLASLSPSYLESAYCEWEFVEYPKYEIGHLQGFNGVAPIYFVQVPGWEDKDFDRRCAAWVAELRRRRSKTQDGRKLRRYKITRPAKAYLGWSVYSAQLPASRLHVKVNLRILSESLTIETESNPHRDR